MALIKYGPVVADARGSVGGTVFSRNSAGAYMKQRTTPTYPGYPKQIARAALLSTLIDDWKQTLTTTERDRWNYVAKMVRFPNKLGELITPSGINLFIRSNFMLDLTGQAHVTAPDPTPIIAAPTLTLTWTTLVGIECTAIGNWDTAHATKVCAQWFLDAPLSKNYYKGPWSNLSSQNGAYYDVLPALIVPSAQLFADTRAFFRFRAVHSAGGVSHPVIYSADVGAVP